MVDIEQYSGGHDIDDPWHRDICFEFDNPNIIYTNTYMELYTLANQATQAT